MARARARSPPMQRIKVNTAQFFHPLRSLLSLHHTLPGCRGHVLCGCDANGSSGSGFTDMQHQLYASLHCGLGHLTWRQPDTFAEGSKHEGHGFLANIYQLRPESRGTVAIRSADPLADPVIRPNYLSTDNDRRVLRAGVRLLREVFAQPAFDVSLVWHARSHQDPAHRWLRELLVELHPELYADVPPPPPRR